LIVGSIKGAGDGDGWEREKREEGGTRGNWKEIRQFFVVHSSNRTTMDQDKLTSKTNDKDNILVFL
jgi:hypothetical protein